MYSTGNVLKDWMRGTFHFGKNFTDSIFASSSEETRKIGGGLLDVVAGIGITHLAVMQELGLIAGVGMALASVASAPLTAVATVGVGIVFTACNLLMGSMGLGLLDAAREKAGLANPFAAARNAGFSVSENVTTMKNSLKADFAKLTASFKKAVKAEKSPTGPSTEKTPTPGNNFNL